MAFSDVCGLTCDKWPSRLLRYKPETILRQVFHVRVVESISASINLIEAFYHAAVT